jgi:cold shock CspA family protein
VRLQGVVKLWKGDRHFGIVEANKEEFLAVSSSVPENSLGQRYLVAGELCDFDVGSTKSRKGYRNAVNISLPWRVPETEVADLSRYREYVTVEYWLAAKRFGFANRELGGGLFIPAREIITEGIQELGTGSVLWTRIARPKPGERTWSAADACILEQDEDGEWRIKPLLPGREEILEQENEVETEQAAPEEVETGIVGVALQKAIASKAESFVGRYKGKKLREISQTLIGDRKND